MNRGEILKFLRKKHNYTQIDIANHLNIKQNTYSQYENNINSPDIDTLIKLADLYMVSLDILCGRIKIQEIDDIKIKAS